MWASASNNRKDVSTRKLHIWQQSLLFYNMQHRLTCGNTLVPDLLASLNCPSSTPAVTKSTWSVLMNKASSIQEWATNVSAGTSAGLNPGEKASVFDYFTELHHWNKQTFLLFVKTEAKRQKRTASDTRSRINNQSDFMFHPEPQTVYHLLMHLEYKKF